MPDTMIERVARALCKAAGDHPDSLYAGPPIDEPVFLSSGAIQPTLGWHKYAPDARAAITAMREPTDGMNQRGRAYLDATDTAPDALNAFKARDLFCTMVDAALAEG